MSNAARDIFKDVEDLKEAGMPEAQAKAILRIQHASIQEGAVTKAELKTELLALETKIEEKIDGLERRLEEKFEKINTEMGSMKQDMGSMKSFMEANFLYLRWMFMSILAVGGGIAIKVFFQ
jgi:hypothetical protein